ncbi:MAG: PD40 domain-containing protein [Proteobacteria bacterium]|nr:PD40 domain-containing protein [Pseudomonadota bacterium]
MFHTESVATKRGEFTDQYPVYSLAFSLDGATIATSSPYGREVHIWSWKGNPQLTRRLPESDNPNAGGGQWGSLGYSPDGKVLACGHGGWNEDNRILRLWDSNTGAVIGDIDDPYGNHGGQGRGPFAFSPDGTTLYRTDNGSPRKDLPRGVYPDTLIAYDLHTWNVQWSLNTPSIFIDGLAVSKDGKRAALVGAQSRPRNGSPGVQSVVVLVDLEERAIRKTVEIPSEYMDIIAWSPDGQRIVAAGNAIVVLDAMSGRVLKQYESPSMPIALMFSPDGTRLIIAWNNGIEIWDGGHTKLLQRIPGRFVHAADLSADGRYLAFSEDFAVSVWEVR